MEFRHKNQLITYLDQLFLFKSGRIVVACIGTNSVLGDCLGAYVGEMLISLNAPCFVYGNLRNPITAKNSNLFARYIKNKHKNSIIIAIDACIGNKIGNITIKNQPIEPAKALNKSLLPIGDISIYATTCTSPPTSTKFLTVPLTLIQTLSTKICHFLLPTIKTYNNHTPFPTTQSLHYNFTPPKKLLQQKPPKNKLE